MIRSRNSRVATVVGVIAACLLASSTTIGASGAGATGSSATTPSAATAAGATAAGAASPATPSAGCASSTIGAGDTTVTTPSGGVDRTYIRHVPPAHDGSTPIPLVIALHGLAEGSVLHQRTSEWAPRADANGFAVVYPQALGSPAAWRLSATGADVAFVTQVLDELEASLCIDTSRVFMSGFSMGAMLTSLLACGPMSARIAAVAPVAGLLDLAANCAPERPVPAISFHGTVDNWVSYTPIPGNVAAWAGRNGCGTPPTETAVPGDDVVTIDHIVYPCPAGAEVEWYEVTGGGHAWPGSQFSRDIASAVGYTTFAITATDLIWDFFAAHPLPPAAPTDGTFDALTYNVAGLPVGLSSSQPDINTPYISPLLNDYDLVLVQEDWANPDPPLAIRVFHELLVADVDHPYLSTPAPVPLGTNPLRPSALLSDGLNQMSRFPFGDLTRVMWPSCFGGANTADGGAADCLAEKGFSVARTELAPGVEVDVYNLHAEAGSTPADQAASAEDFEVLGAFITAHSAGRAVLVGGDFNLHTDRADDGKVFDDFLHTTGLTDVCEVVDCGTEADRIDKFVFRGGSGTTLTPLDHVFEAETFVRPTDGAPLSDHEPLHVPFRWSVDPAAPASIRGTVTDPEGAPVVGAVAAAYRPADGWLGTARAVTDATGSYSIEGLPAGSDYQVVFAPPTGSGLVAEWFRSSVRSGSTPIAVTAAGVAPAIDAQLDRAASITGTVVADTGGPIAGVQVWAYAPTNGWVGTAGGITGADGRYAIEGLPAGSYRVLFAPLGLGYAYEWFDDARTRAAATTLTVTVGGPAGSADAALAGL